MYSRNNIEKIGPFYAEITGPNVNDASPDTRSR